MSAGSRKLAISSAAIVLLLGLGARAGALQISDPAVESISAAISWVGLGCCGGNGVEHVAQALSTRGPRPPA